MILIIIYIQSFAKKQKHIVIHIITNDATRLTSRKILDKLLKLKTLITLTKEISPETGVGFSTPTIRSDNGKAPLMVGNLCDHIVNLTMDILDNRNTTGKHLDYKGSHLNKAGSTRLRKILFLINKNFDRLWNA